MALSKNENTFEQDLDRVPKTNKKGSYVYEATRQTAEPNIFPTDEDRYNNALKTEEQIRYNIAKSETIKTTSNSVDNLITKYC